MKLEMKVDTEGMGAAIVDGTRRAARRAWTKTQLFLAACVIPALIFLSLMTIGLTARACGGPPTGIGFYPH